MKNRIARAAGRISARRILGSVARPSVKFAFSSVATVLAATATSAHAGGCVGDFDGNGVVDGADLSSLLNGWGSSASQFDLDGNGLVDGGDLAQVLNAWGACPPSAPPAETGIACQSSALYPYALFVNSYNLNETVRFGVDSQRFPDLAGRTVDIYLLDNRTGAGWAANPTLVDVRGTPQAFAVGATLLASTGTLTMTGLAAGSGDSPGRGFDLVVDADRNGVLSAGDLVDGGGDALGMWYVKDLSAAGPYAVSQVASYDVNDVDILDSMELERIYYPSTIASLAPRPLVVISHGNGHNYAWYDYLGNHLASWGYVVMSHQNDTVPGIETASTTTLEHTESFLAQLGTIAAGALNGKVDGDRIVWIGHSRGGEGLARGYDRLFDNTFTSPNYQIADIRLLISIAPTDFLGTASANPHGVPFMLVYGAADGDVCGCPDSDIADSFNLLERAEGWRQSTYVHGADHNDFNCCGFNDFAGPTGTAIANAEAQDVMKAASLAMIRRVVDGDRSAEEYLWRQYESLKPISVASTTTVISEWKPAPALITALDSFQTNSATSLGSAGGAVAFSGLGSILEAIQNDADTSFTWLTTDQWNGATRGRTTDTTRGMLFEWAAAASGTWTLPVSMRDLTDDAAVSLRAAQGTRHPNTISTLADLTFTVVLVDENGIESAVNIAAFGGGVEEPYQRTGFGTGAGWQNAYEAIRIPLWAFKAENRSIDLTRVASIVLRFGGANGSASGRLHIDDLQIERE